RNSRNRHRKARSTLHLPAERSRASSAASKGSSPREFSAAAEVLGDAEQLVVLGHAIGAASAAGFDLTGTCCHGQISDKRVFGLSRAVADYVAVACVASQLDRFHRLGQRADLVDLDENRISRTFLDSPAQV